MFQLEKSHQICAVITSFRPDAEFASRVERISCQVGQVVIVNDNDSDVEMRRRLNDFERQIPNVRVHHNERNYGLADSLNIGMRLAKSLEYRFVVLFDDDTIPDQDMIERLIKAWQRITSENRRPVALIRLAHRDKYTGSAKNYSAETEYVEKRGIITSGTLLPTSVYERIGPFRSEFFIDSVDYDYCLRARALGFRVVQMPQIGLNHAVGHRTQKKIGPFCIETTNHNSIRRYYLYRNSTVLALEYLKIDPLYSFAVWVFQVSNLFKIIILENNRQEKVAMALRGIYDGWRRRLGRFESAAMDQ